ncbi:MAG TPA: FAD-dependent oxidoreductase, partial [Polyangiaceae bacterium]
HQVTAGRPEYYVHFCGEHTSIDFRGTLEGAAESGALTAAQILAERGIPLPEPLERLVSLKLTQPQPWMRGWDARLPRPLARRREVLEAHAAFVNTLL